MFERFISRHFITFVIKCFNASNCICTNPRPITTPAYELSRKQGFYDANPGTDTAIKQLSLNQPTANSRGVRFGNFVQIRDIINEEMEAIWNGSKSASDGLDDAARRGDKLLRKFERANK